jgi:hypothetical protein
VYVGQRSRNTPYKTDNNGKLNVTQTSCLLTLSYHSQVVYDLRDYGAFFSQQRTLRGIIGSIFHEIKKRQEDFPRLIGKKGLKC